MMFPLEYLPQNFGLKDVVVLHLVLVVKYQVKSVINCSNRATRQFAKKNTQNANYQVRTSGSPCRDRGESYQDRLIMSQKSKL